MRQLTPSDHDWLAFARGRARRLLLGAAAGAVLIGLIVGLTAAWRHARGRTPVAQVGDHVVTTAEWQEALRRQEGAAALRTLMDHLLLERRARELNIRVTPAMLDAKLKEAIAQVGTEQDWQQRLAVQQRTKDQVLRELRYEVLLDEIVARELKVTPEEIRRYYDEHQAQFSHQGRVHARLILLDTEANANEIHKMLQAGGPFPTWAGLVSTDPGSKDHGGDLGWIERGDYAREITDVAFSLQQGQFSRPFRAPDGWALVRSEGIQSGAVRPLSEVEDEVAAVLRAQMTTDLRATWLADARHKAKVAILDPKLRRAYEAQEAPEGEDPGLLPALF